MCINVVCVVKGGMFHKVTFKKPIRIHNKGFIINPNVSPAPNFPRIWRHLPKLIFGEFSQILLFSGQLPCVRELPCWRWNPCQG